MGYYVFQGLIVFAVMASNIHWQWTPNGYLASAAGIGTAYVITAGLQKAREKMANWKVRAMLPPPLPRSFR
jgi:hypothetical protein